MTNLDKFRQFFRRLFPSKNSKVKRVEVIDHSIDGEGRMYVKMNAKSVSISYQDQCRTLKILIK